MKRLIFVIVTTVFFTSDIFADIIKLQATDFAYKSKSEYGYWSDWSSWESCSVLVVVNTSNDRVNVYSSTPQEYDIYNYGDVQSDSEGGQISTLSCVDADGLRCEMRLRQQRDGQWQLYIDYADFMFVYNVQHK